MNYIFRQILTVAATAAVSFAAWAEIPAGYYSKLNGKTGSELKTAVFEIINPHTEVSSYSDLPKYFQRTDMYPESNRWWDMYGNIPLYGPSFSGLNREHSFPKSWWKNTSYGSGDINVTYTPAYVDLNHLYPSEARANQAKSNYPLGTVASVPSGGFDNGVVKVGIAVSGQGGGAKYVFEPSDEYKGDFARTYFYMVTCYQNLTWNPSYLFMLNQGAYPTLNKWSQDLLLRWAREDQVSQKEIDRNEVVYSIQSNRNPFIDFPSLADYIWGDKVGEPFYTDIPDTPVGDPTLITPVQDMELDFGQVAIGSSTTAKLHLRGENLTGNLRLRVYSADAACFAVSDSRVSASLANNADGYWVTVTYTPSALGIHTSRLLIDSGGLVGSIGIGLRAECLEVPVLSRLTATAATDVTENSYTAHWDAPDEVVDYYVVTRTRYTAGSSAEEKLVAEDNSIDITEFDASESESYYVQSSRLGYLSEPSNVVFVSHSGIQGVDDTANTLGWAGFPGGIRLVCGTPHTGGIIYDATGRTVMVLPVIENNTELMLPPGVYIIATDQSRRPVTVIIR